MTHLTDLEKTATSSLGELRIIPKQAILKLWDRLFTILGQYRDNWSLDDVRVRRGAATAVLRKLPPDGWLTRALSHDDLFVSERELIAEWP